MPLAGYLLMLISGLAIALSGVLQFLRDSRVFTLAVQLVAVALTFVGVVLFFGLPGNLVSKGPDDERSFIQAVTAIYVCIVMGMLCEGFYTWFDKPDRFGVAAWTGEVLLSRSLCRRSC